MLYERVPRYFCQVVTLTLMSTDPYHLLQSEIQVALQTALTLRASYVRIRSMALAGNGKGKGKEGEGEELVWARNEVRGPPLACRGEMC
jgi:hypothetical protein